MRVLRAWAGPLEQQAGWGIARQLFGPVVGAGGDDAEWDALDVGAASLARRVLDPDRSRRPRPGTRCTRRRTG